MQLNSEMDIDYLGTLTRNVVIIIIWRPLLSVWWLIVVALARQVHSQSDALSIDVIG